MSDSFDSDAIAANSARKMLIEEAAKKNRRLVDCPHHFELYAQFEKLEDAQGTRHLKPQVTLDPMTVYVYGKDGEQNLQVKHTLDSASVKYEFPNGLTVIRLRKQPLTYRLEDDYGHHIVVSRQRELKRGKWFWEVMGLPTGFSQSSGKRASTRYRGSTAEQSFG